MNLLRKVKFSPKSVPWALLALCAAAFGLLIPFVGFYWDDWAKILVARVWGLQGYWAYYAEDRPLSGWTHILFTPILGYRPLAWQLFSLLLTWLSAVSVWWALTRLWPTARRRAVFTALLFAVYPVFTLRSASVTFHQQWLQYALFLFSLGAMLQAVRRPRRFWLWTGLALLAMALQLTVTEYFAPLELLRPLALWFLVGEQAGTLKQRLLRTLKLWAPYLAVTAGYIIWRLFFIRLTGSDPYSAKTLYDLFLTPVATLTSLAGVVLRDSLYTLVTTWTQIFNIGPATSIVPFDLAALAVSALVAVVAAVYLVRLVIPGEQDIHEPRDTTGQALALGLLAAALGMMPAWVTGREVVFDFHSNRYAMPAMFGAALVWVAALEWFVVQPKRRALLIGLMLGVAVNLQLRTLNDDRWIWKQQTDVFWQLAWRAPYIQPGTAIMSENEPFANQGLFSTSAALNQLYPQPADAPTLAYWWYTLLPRYAGGVPDSLEIGFSTQFRTLVFKGSTPRSLLLNYDLKRGSCVWVLGPDDAADPYLSGLVRGFIPISNQKMIQPEAPVAGFPPTEMFGSEPAHDWCYFFEKADLARQVGDWQAAADLGNQAQAKGYSPTASGSNAPHEWLPFIEAYANTGQVEEGRSLTREALSMDERYAPLLCKVWQRVGDAEMEKELGCSS